MNFLDLRTVQQQRAARLQHRQRHQLNWRIIHGAIEPLFTCLHATLPEGHVCAAQTLREYPEILFEGFLGSSADLRDGIMVSHWEGSSDPCSDNGAELFWTYEDQDLHGSVSTQRHALRFEFAEDGIKPVFECLHEALRGCHANEWNDGSLWLFPEWCADPGPTPLSAGIIVSWWSAGTSSPTELPHWVYQERASTVIPRAVALTKENHA